MTSLVDLLSDVAMSSTGTVFGAIAGLVVFLVREILGMARLSKVDALRQSAEAVQPGTDRAAAVVLPADRALAAPTAARRAPQRRALPLRPAAPGIPPVWSSR